MADLERLAGREIILELMQNGDLVRASAIDGETGLEGVIIAPVTAARSDMERLAMQKLAWVLERAGCLGPQSPNELPGTSPTTRRGVWV